jgi:hypothetical protein
VQSPDLRPTDSPQKAVFILISQHRPGTLAIKGRWKSSSRLWWDFPIPKEMADRLFGRRVVLPATA